MPKIKGNILAARLSVLDKLFPEDGRRTVWPHLTQEEQEILGGNILPGSWYESTLLSKLMAAVDSELGRGDHELTRRMGYHAAAIQLGDVYETFIRPGTPEHLLTRCSNIWNLTHDYGRVEVKITGDHRCRIRLFDIDAVTVQGLVGWVQQGLELSGCKRIRHRCSPCPGFEETAFEMRWAWRMDDGDHDSQ